MEQGLASAWASRRPAAGRAASLEADPPEARPPGQRQAGAQQQPGMRSCKRPAPLMPGRRPPERHPRQGRARRRGRGRRRRPPPRAGATQAPAPRRARRTACTPSWAGHTPARPCTGARASPRVMVGGARRASASIELHAVLGARDSRIAAHKQRVWMGPPRLPPSSGTLRPALRCLWPSRIHNG